MAHPSSLDNLETVAEPQVSVLNLLVLLAENAKYLLAVSLLVGSAVWGWGVMQPMNFQSTAVLQTDALPASVARSPNILDAVARQGGLLPGESIQQARVRVQKHISVTVSRDKLLTLTVSASTPEQTQQLMGWVLEQIYKVSRPKEDARKRLETQLLEARAQLSDAQIVATYLQRSITTASGTSRYLPESGRAYAELLTVRAATRTQIHSLETLLEGVTSAQLVQQPTLSTSSSTGQHILVAMVAALGAAFLLLAGIVARNAWRNLCADPLYKEQVSRIQRALGFKHTQPQ